MSYVLDASVVLKALIEEIHSADAYRIVGLGVPLHAPSLMAIEVGNALWKLFRRNQLSRLEVAAAISGLRALTIAMHSRDELLERAVDIATSHDRSVYDSMYLALAEDLDLPLITADRRLYNAIAGTALASRIRWIENALAD